MTKPLDDRYIQIRPNGTWQVSIWRKPRHYHVGTYQTKIEAITARNTALDNMDKGIFPKNKPKISEQIKMTADKIQEMQLLLHKEKTCKEIAEILSVSANTIRRYKRELETKPAPTPIIYSKISEELAQQISKCLLTSKWDTSLQLPI